MSFELEPLDELLEENRLRWACRRGMLELDILLGGFIDNGYQQLTNDEKFIFQDLLLEADQQLYEYFMKNAEVKDKNLEHVIQKIRRAAAA
ncbi:MAG: succinate dehydrogenase assembly factor 2 [Gammaproteobacteria bacterium]|nr:succinate dehydrogenase assembly factor 2 [Gammaproteobacteria bacterium]